MIRNFTDAVTFLGTPKARLIGAVCVGIFLGYSFKSSSSEYAIASSPNGTYRMKTSNGETWMITNADGRAVWSKVADRESWLRW